MARPGLGLPGRRARRASLPYIGDPGAAHHANFASQQITGRWLAAVPAASLGQSLPREHKVGAGQIAPNGPMPAQSAMLSGAVPDRSPLGWLILLPLGCLVLGQLLLVTTGIVPVLDGLLVDPDGYMRLNRVLALHDGGSWFDSRYWRINPPEGPVQHWTRPLDA